MASRVKIARMLRLREIRCLRPFWILGAVAWISVSAAPPPAELIIQRGPQIEVDSAVYSPDGRLIASSGESETIRLWDRESGDLVATLPGHPERVFGVAFSPDGKLLASSSTDGSVKLWDYRQEKLLFTFTNHLGNWARRVAFSPDSRLLAPAAYDGKISLWDTATGQVVRTLPMKGKVTEVLFTPDGRWLVTSLRDDRRPLIEFWNVTNGAPGLTINATNSLVELAISADGARLASSSMNGLADVWELPAGKLLREFKLPEKGACLAVDISPDGRRVAAGQHFVNTIWSVDTGALLAEMRGHDDDTFQIHFSPDGSEIVSASADASIRQWDAVTGKVKRIIAPHPPDTPVTSIAFSPDGTWEAVGGVDGVVRVWDARSGAFKYELRGHEGPVQALAFSLDSAWLCSGSADRTMRVWDMAHGTISAVHPYFERTDSIGSEAFGGTENLIASAGGPWTGANLDKEIRLWETHFDRPIRVLRGHAANVCSVAFAHGVDLLASASVDGTAKLWNTRTAECLATETNVFIHTLAFSPDGRWIAAGCADGGVCVLNTNGLAVARSWRAHQRPVQSLAFSSGGHWLATASADQTIAMWDWPTGKELRRFTSVTSQYLPLAFLPQQPVLAFAQNDQIVVHVNVQTGEILFKREFFPDGEWLAWNPTKPFYLASPRGAEHARLRFANQLSPVYPLSLYRRELSRPTNFLAALAGPAPALAPKNFQLWWFRYPHKQAWLYGALSGLSGWIIVFLRRGWVAERRRRAQENISRQLLVSQEAERKRIAAELHDSLGQNLLIIKNRLHLAQQAVAEQASRLSNPAISITTPKWRARHRPRCRTSCMKFPRPFRRPSPKSAKFPTTCGPTSLTGSVSPKPCSLSSNEFLIPASCKSKANWRTLTACFRRKTKSTSTASCRRA